MKYADIRMMLNEGQPPGFIIDTERSPDSPALTVIVYRDNLNSFPDMVAQGMLLWLHDKLKEINKIVPVELEVSKYVPKE